MDRRVWICRSDNGQGIAPEVLPHVFEKFRQADQSITRTHGGLGLGLAIVRHLAELHGGSVVAQSKGAGEGATFTVRLPIMVMRGEPARVTKPAAEVEVSRSLEEIDLSGMRIIAVNAETAARSPAPRQHQRTRESLLANCDQQPGSPGALTLYPSSVQRSLTV